jgi:glucose/arabinose dehydrogenase
MPNTRPPRLAAQPLRTRSTPSLRNGAPRCGALGSQALGSRSLGSIVLLGAVLALVALPNAPAAAAPSEFPGVQMVEAWPDLEFNEPIDITNGADGSDMLYVAEQKGVIKAIPKYRGTGKVPRPSVLLDLRSAVYARAQGGLLSITCHPSFKSNGLLYVSYLAKNPSPGPQGLTFKLVIAEYRVRGGKADPKSARVILEVLKSNAQHHAGCIRFGPDKMLYIGVGDAKDEESAQNPRSLFGKVLRIDPGAGDRNRPYGIPKGNPWPKISGVRPEIWGFGFRNPWRFGWDTQGRLFAVEPGTKGPESREWVMQVKYGGNHGWPYMEGSRKLKNPPKPKTFVPATFEYVRGSGGATAGIGGTVYRGDRVKALRGKYVFGDYMRGEVYCIDLTTVGGSNPAKQRVVGSNHRALGGVPEFAGLGEDEQGELYFCANEMGTIFTLAPSP